MKKGIFVAIITVILLLSANQVYYLTSLQFTCTEKIERKQELNAYEIFSALQTHLAIGIFGRVIEPNVANMCLIKQFDIHPSSTLGLILRHRSKVEDDDVIKKAKQKLLSKQTNIVRLAWKQYTSRASILYNGSTLFVFIDEYGYWWSYDTPVDYKPGIININGITISETVFDYLENKGYLSVYYESYSQPFTEDEIKKYRSGR